MTLLFGESVWRGSGIYYATCVFLDICVVFFMTSSTMRQNLPRFVFIFTGKEFKVIMLGLNKRRPTGPSKDGGTVRALELHPENWMRINEL